MLINNASFKNENTKRLSYGIAIAIFFHAGILIWLSQNPSQNTLSSDLFSPPTNVTIRFQTPVKTTPKLPAKLPPKVTTKSHPAPILKKTKPTPKKTTQSTPKKQTPVALNAVAPAAPSQQKTTPAKQKPVSKSIPIISEQNLKGRRVQPTYPKRALKMRQEGTVWLRVLISETGARQDIKMHKPSQYALLNQAAIKAVKKWTFAPNIVNGSATKSWVEIPIEFKIQ